MEPAGEINPPPYIYIYTHTQTHERQKRAGKRGIKQTLKLLVSLKKYIAQTQASHFTNPNKNLQGEGEKQSKPEPQPRTVSSFPHETLQQQREDRKRKRRSLERSALQSGTAATQGIRRAPRACGRPPGEGLSAPPGRGCEGEKRYLCRRPVPKAAGRETREAGGSRQTFYGSDGAQRGAAAEEAAAARSEPCPPSEKVISAADSPSVVGARTRPLRGPARSLARAPLGAPPAARPLAAR